MDIAIIGYAFSLPGCKTLPQLRRLLFSGADAISAGWTTTSAETDDENWISNAGYIDDHNQFDYGLFGVSLRDSLIIDPQQRMFCQMAYKALEHAGYNPKAMHEPVGVYSAASDTHYVRAVEESGLALELYDPFEIEIGSNKEQQSLRASYLLNLTGPSMGVQSACSSGLLTLHIAMQGLKTGDCEVALAGGSCFPYPIHQGYRYREGMNWSKKGRIRSFDQHADGMIAGFGSVVWVLKPLAKARDDRDCIHAVIKAECVNNDGLHKSTYTAPSTSAIAHNLKNLLERAGVSANEIDFIEAHGSGTRIGDVIEAAALRIALGHGDSGHSTAVSSIKSVVGHLDTVAGHAGLLKAVTQLQSNAIAPAANFEKLNPAIQFENSGLFVPVEAKPGARLGVVNSLGIGGTNCALLIEAAPKKETINFGSGETSFVLGAESPQRLLSLACLLQQELAQCDYNLRDVAFTLGRRALAKPVFAQFSATSIEDLMVKLGRLNESDIRETAPTELKSQGCSVPLYSSEVDSAVIVELESLQSSHQKEKTDSSQLLETVSLEKAPLETVPLETILANIWKENLMVSSVSDNSSFEGLGGHSMAALSVLDDLKQQLDIILPLDWMEANDLFSQQIESLKVLAQSNQEFDCIKILRKCEKPRARVVLVHASLSGAEKYTMLPEYLSDNFDVIAIDSWNLYADADDFIRDVHQLGSYYAKQLRKKVSPEQEGINGAEAADASCKVPLILGGWSLGGMLANVIAADLADKYAVVAHFAIDSVLFQDSYRSLFADNNLKYFLDVDNFVGTRKDGYSANHRRLEELFSVERKMAIDFQRRDLRIPMLNIVATEPKYPITDSEVLEDFKLAKKDNGWSSAENIETVYLRADHEQVVEKNNLRVISELLERLADEQL